MALNQAPKPAAQPQPAKKRGRPALVPLRQQIMERSFWLQQRLL